MTGKLSADDVLYAFAVEADHGAETLASYLRRYPEHALDLLDLAHEIRLSADDAAGTEPDAEDETTIRAAWEQFVACRPDTVETLFEQIKGPAFATLAEKLCLPRSLLTAVKNRQVIPASYPERFLRRLADAMAANLDHVRAYVSLSPVMPAQAAFKATGKPAAQQQVSFDELVSNTPMTDAERDALRRGMQ